MNTDYENMTYKAIKQNGLDIEIRENRNGLSRLYLKFDGSRLDIEPVVFSSNKRSATYLTGIAHRTYKNSHLGRAMIEALTRYWVQYRNLTYKDVSVGPFTVSVQEFSVQHQNHLPIEPAKANDLSISDKVLQKLAGVDTATHTIEELMELTGATKKQLWYVLGRNNLKCIKARNIRNQITERLSGVDTASHTMEELIEITGSPKRQIQYVLSKNNMKYIHSRKRKLAY